MKKAIFFLFPIMMLLAVISGCSSQPQAVYKPAKNSGFGYKETLLGPNNYRVEFKSSGSAKKAQDNALLRAAELTTEQGYDWFVVTKRELDANSERKSIGPDFNSRQAVERNCGLLGCNTRVQSMPEFDMGVDENPFSEVNVILEINFGKGIRPSTKNTYDAIETKEKLSAKI